MDDSSSVLIAVVAALRFILRGEISLRCNIPLGTGADQTAYNR
jgi:hypothetical protein